MAKKKEYTVTVREEVEIEVVVMATNSAQAERMVRNGQGREENHQYNSREILHVSRNED